MQFGITFAIMCVAVAKKLIRRIPMELIRRFVREEEGQGLVEYALILGLIAIVAIAALTTAGNKIKTGLNTVGSAINVTS